MPGPCVSRDPRDVPETEKSGGGSDGMVSGEQSPRCSSPERTRHFQTAFCLRCARMSPPSLMVSRETLPTWTDRATHSGTPLHVQPYA